MVSQGSTGVANRVDMSHTGEEHAFPKWFAPSVHICADTYLLGGLSIVISTPVVLGGVFLALGHGVFCVTQG